MMIVVAEPCTGGGGEREWDSREEDKMESRRIQKLVDKSKGNAAREEKRWRTKEVDEEDE